MQGPDGTHCPQCGQINEVLSRVGDRWSVLIVFSLLSGKMRFNELKRQLGISQRMLSLSLRHMERDGLVSRTQYPTIPPKVEYALTDLGLSFAGPVKGMAQWALDNLTTIDSARTAFDAEQGEEA
ncbi:winged helix-turn-helix transcriptional regulator [Poseidonocella sedimentorum]|uniref:DNA-binding transcriptional regulator, HxlR family n=1 Tax=Poseidonocella sedimentorum TaxID=871652 RepID=A0A1I6DQ00_9RHOB|nr:helix-turn-helix domain-containing protein [Poseidonocella sedimentorum]SFR07442.1 DNA-binding transcriptional regulator, HxlR family [Poseidonocella sedimentorum]